MILIKNGRLMDPASKTDGYRDILIHEGRIAKIGFCGTLDDMAAEAMAYYADSDPQGQLCEIDAGGMIVAPGLVDAHVHFRDPGFTKKEDIHTGAEAAKHGGFTSVVMMGNTEPHMDNPETIRYALEKGMETGIRVFTCANITMGMNGNELTDMEGLLKEGAVLFTDDGKPITDENIMRKACLESARLGKVLSLHEENPEFITDNGINAGEAAELQGLKGSPREAEISMVKRDIEIAGETGAHITIQHISTKEAVDMVREARKTNPRIHAEATPHHFTLTDDAVREWGTMAKMNPPLRKEEDRLAIIEGLADGTIETIATDHAPHTAEEKAAEFSKAPSGIIGLETSLGLGIRELVQKGHLDLMTLLSRMTYQVANIYELGAVGRIFEGGPADLVIFSENETRKVGEKFASKASNSPFIGQELPGKIYYTICGGRVYDINSNS
ncbi:MULTISPECIES: dihydroorotase [unclassified Butyrivibrio]|uniref:dihydroorotase n=1 Tax=unclassified Butyrivibrio TaxID=2639466 RepID=UPI0003B40E57|nr:MULTISPECIES: dihydroorotase [unclassified Butyrivibrio]